jgi:hypothetical protein
MEKCLKLVLVLIILVVFVSCSAGQWQLAGDLTQGAGEVAFMAGASGLISTEQATRVNTIAKLAWFSEQRVKAAVENYEKFPTEENAKIIQTAQTDLDRTNAGMSQ